MGRSGWSTYRTVVLPQLMPAIGAGGLLVALYVLSDFGAVSILRFDSFTRAIYASYRASFDRIGAASLAALLVVLMFVVLWLEGRTRRRFAYHRTAPGAARRPQPRAARALALARAGVLRDGHAAGARDTGVGARLLVAPERGRRRGLVGDLLRRSRLRHGRGPRGGDRRRVRAAGRDARRALPGPPRGAWSSASPSPAMRSPTSSWR